MRHRSHHFVFFFFFFLGPLVGRRSSLFRSNSHFRFPLITYSSYIMPFELLLSSAFISRWKYQFSSDHWSQATSSVVSTWMGDRLGTPRNADIFCLFFIFFLRSTLSLPFQFLATSISESTRATNATSLSIFFCFCFGEEQPAYPKRCVIMCISSYKCTVFSPVSRITY